MGKQRDTERARRLYAREAREGAIRRPNDTGDLPKLENLPLAHERIRSRSRSPVRSVEAINEPAMTWESRPAAEDNPAMAILVDEIPAVLSGKMSKDAKRRYRKREKMETSKARGSHVVVVGNDDDRFSEESANLVGGDEGTVRTVVEDALFNEGSQMADPEHASEVGGGLISLAIRNKDK